MFGRLRSEVLPNARAHAPRPELVAEVEDVIRALLSDRIMMVLVTHAVRFAREVAHRIAYMSDGVVAEIRSAADVLDRQKDPTLKEFLRRIR